MRIYKKAILLFILCLAMLLTFQCTENEKQESVNIPTGKNVPAPSFVIGILAEKNVFTQKKQYNALVGYLSKTIGLDVKTTIYDGYDHIYDELQEGKVDAAFLGGLSYVVINSKVPLEPIARPYLKDGTSINRGVIFTIKNRGINRDVRTWKDKRIALVNKSSYSGYVFPLWYLHESGVKDLKSYFRRVIYTGSINSSITAVFQGQADIGCASDRIYNELIEKDFLMREKLEVIASSPSLPYNTFVMKKSADHILKEKIKAGLLNMDKTPDGREALSMIGATGFIGTKESEYSPLSGMLEDLGMKPGDFALELIELLHVAPELVK
jgi:phosphonate transport system substrate-binding protein